MIKTYQQFNRCIHWIWLQTDYSIRKTNWTMCSWAYHRRVVKGFVFQSLSRKMKTSALQLTTSNWSKILQPDRTHSMELLLSSSSEQLMASRSMDHILSPEKNNDWTSCLQIKNLQEPIIKTTAICFNNFELGKRQSLLSSDYTRVWAIANYLGVQSVNETQQEHKRQDADMPSDNASSVVQV